MIARIVGQAGQPRRLGAGGDDAVIERDRPVVDRSDDGPMNVAKPWITSTLRCLASTTSPPVSRSTTPVFHSISCADVDLRLAEGDPVRAPSPRSRRSRGRRAAAPWRGCSRRSGRRRRGGRSARSGGLQSEVGGAERSGVAAGARAEHDDLEVALAAGDAAARGAGSSVTCASAPPAALGGRPAAGSGRRRPGHCRPRRPLQLQLAPRRPTRTSSARCPPTRGRRPVRQLLDDAVDGRGHVHRRLVGFERDERVLGGDRVADGDQDLDDRDVVEVADVGDAD